MVRTTYNRVAIVAGTLAVATGLSATQAMGVSVDWLGPTGSDKDWGNSANWVDGVVPGTDDGTNNIDVAIFRNSTLATAETPATAVAVRAVNPDAGRRIRQLLFAGGVSAYTIGESGSTTALTMSTSTATLPSVQANPGSSTFTINSPLIFLSAGTLAAGGNVNSNTTLLFNGSITMPSDSTLSVTGPGTVLLNGAVSGDVSVTGTSTSAGRLGGNGTINNSGANGVTLAAGTKLAPGAAASAAGTLTMDLGSKGLDISAAVGGDNVGALVFDLDTIADSDQVALLNDTVLHIGSGGLEFDDFVFTLGENFGDGVYTLFSGNAAINGTFGSNLTGTLNDLDAQLAFANGNQDIVLLVGSAVPEPTALGMLAIGAMGLMARRRRN